MISFTEAIKYAVYRTPGLSRLMAPSYPLKISPGEITTILHFVDCTREAGGAVIEIGVAKGNSSVFLLEHLKTTEDPRPLHLFDTFSGFTDESVAFERVVRGKPFRYGQFRYGDRATFERNIRAAGYTSFRTYTGDASQFDWSTLAPIGAVLLDIDLYQPTAAVLQAIYPHVVEGGGIVVDDCQDRRGKWDGSLQAYQEFVAANGLPFEIVGGKGGVIRR